MLVCLEERELVSEKFLDNKVSLPRCGNVLIKVVQNGKGLAIRDQLVDFSVEFLNDLLAMFRRVLDQFFDNVFPVNISNQLDKVAWMRWDRVMRRGIYIYVCVCVISQVSIGSIDLLPFNSLIICSS